jgi:hypothetical protein
LKPKITKREITPLEIFFLNKTYVKDRKEPRSTLSIVIIFFLSKKVKRNREIFKQTSSSKPTIKKQERGRNISKPITLIKDNKTTISSSKEPRKQLVKPPLLS